MRGAEIQPKTEIQLKKAERSSRPSVWGRLLLTGALLLSISGCAMAEVKKPAVQQKDQPLIAQAAREGNESNRKNNRVHCTKESKFVTILDVKKKFTAETCDNWDYVKTYFNNREFLVNDPLPINSDFGGRFTDRQVNLGTDTCRSYIIKGKSKTFKFFLVSDVVATSGDRVKTFTIDSGVLATNDVQVNINQLKENCEWKLIFSSADEKYILLVTENGKVRDEPSFTK